MTKTLTKTDELMNTCANLMLYGIEIESATIDAFIVEYLTDQSYGMAPGELFDYNTRKHYDELVYNDCDNRYEVPKDLQSGDILCIQMGSHLYTMIIVKYDPTTLTCTAYTMGVNANLTGRMMFSDIDLKPFAELGRILSVARLREEEK